MAIITKDTLVDNIPGNTSVGDIVGDVIPLEDPASATVDGKASDANKTREYVEYMVGSNTARFQGEFSTEAEIPTTPDGYRDGPPTNNDYIVVRDMFGTDSTGDIFTDDGAQVGSIGANGVIDTSTTGFRYTAAIPVPNKDGWHVDLIASEISGTANFRLHAYDEDGTWIKQVCFQQSEDGKVNVSEYIPTGTKTLRVSYLNGSTVSLYVHKYVGTWRWIYTGEWETDGVGGWSPAFKMTTDPLTPSQTAALNSGITEDLVKSIGIKLVHDADANVIKLNDESITSYAQLLSLVNTGRAVLIGSAKKSEVGSPAIFRPHLVGSAAIYFDATGTITNDGVDNIYTRRISASKSGSDDIVITETELTELQDALSDAQLENIAAVPDKRDKTDLDVYPIVQTENTDWTIVNGRNLTEEFLSEVAAAGESFKPYFYDGYWFLPQLPNFRSDPQDIPGTYDRDVLTISSFFYYKIGHITDEINFDFTRPRYMDEHIGPAKENEKLASRDTTAAQGVLAKFGEGGKLVAATESDVPHDSIKRDKTDLDVYSVTRMENTDWTWTSADNELEAKLNDGAVKPVYDRHDYWTTNKDPDGYYSETYDFGERSSLSGIVTYTRIRDGQTLSATATRPRYMDEQLGPAKQNQRLTAVAAGDAQAPSDGDLMKYDSVNDRFVKAEKSSASADPANADYRDPQDNTCHKTEFTEWAWHDMPSEYSFVNHPQPTFVRNNYWSWLDDDDNEWIAFGASLATSLTFENTHGTELVTATRSAVCTDGKKFVTDDVVDGKVSAAVSKNNPAFASAVSDIVKTDSDTRDEITTLAEAACADNPSASVASLEGRVVPCVSGASGTVDVSFAARKDGDTTLRFFDVLIKDVPSGGCQINLPPTESFIYGNALKAEEGWNHYSFAEFKDGDTYKWAVNRVKMSTSQS